MLIALAVAVVLAMAASACHKNTSDSQAKAKISAAANTPQNQEALKVAQDKVASCLSKGTVVTKAGRQSIYVCVAPPAQQHALKACALSAATKENLATKKGRQQWGKVDLPNCLVQVQKGAK